MKSRIVSALVDDAIRSGATREQLLSDVDFAYISAVLNECDGNQCEVARVLGIHRNTVARRIHGLQIRRPGAIAKKPVQAEVSFYAEQAG